MLLRCLSLGDWFIGVIIFELIERECNPICEADGFGNGIWGLMEKFRHLTGRFQVSFGIDAETTTCFVQRDMLANAGDDILQFAPFG